MAPHHPSKLACERVSSGPTHSQPASRAPRSLLEKLHRVQTPPNAVALSPERTRQVLRRSWIRGAQSADAQTVHGPGASPGMRETAETSLCTCTTACLYPSRRCGQPLISRCCQPPPSSGLCVRRAPPSRARAPPRRHCCIRCFCCAAPVSGLLAVTTPPCPTRVRSLQLRLPSDTAVRKRTSCC
jgi:hypothetical protein